jgi:hypothetical protein
MAWRSHWRPHWRPHWRSHWCMQSHQTQASGIIDALQGDEARAARVWTAAQESPRFGGQELLLARALSALQAANRPGQTSAHVGELRSLAQQFAQRPAYWTDAQIRNAVGELAQQHGITAPNQIAVMVDMLQRPGLSQQERVEALGQSRSLMSNCVTAITRTLDLPPRNFRNELAQRIGMPFSAVVARIGAPGDAGLGARVIGRINPSHRDGVAELLLTAQPGSQLDRAMYVTLETIFTTDPYYSDRQGAMPFMRRLFATDRLEMLRVMGFDNEQILRMNPVGNELAKRFDPALGTYSPQEQALRAAKGLPNTREAAALRLLTATTEGGKSMSYRRWVALGVLSDTPWSLPRDVDAAYLSVAPGTSATGGSDDANFAFRVAENLRGRTIPRGPRPDLMDRDYRHDINRVLLQTFGLGATHIGSGRLESIPTSFEPRDRPTANTSPNTPARGPLGPQDPDQPDVSWQELLPLLLRR